WVSLNRARLDGGSTPWDHGRMPDRSRKRPTDLNSLAASIVADSTDEDKPEPADDAQDPAAVSAGAARRV
ncbi:MAG: hypothetical protein WKF73_11235, partial [Nocardioidaceae bacterium]